MNTRQKLAAVLAAKKEGRELPELWAAQSPQVLNNLNYISGSTVETTQPSGVVSSPNSSNLNNLKAQPEKKRGGVPRLELYTDEALKKAMAWGVEEWLVQVCIRDYGLYKVKAQINRIYQLPEGYFKPQYGPIDKQRGRIFNMEMQKLRKAKA